MSKELVATKDSSPALPQFLLVGAMKSATTTLWETIRQHPQIFMPTLKEPHFFVKPEYLELISKEGKAQLEASTPAVFDEYRALFANSLSHQIRGEASASYFLLPDISIPRIRKELGDVRIVISLRNPYDRTWSEFKMHEKDHLVSNPSACFTKQVLEALDGDCSTIPQYIAQSLYCSRVEAFLRSFSHVHIVVFEDLLKDPRSTLHSLYSFLGVDPLLGLDTLPHKNESEGIPTAPSAIIGVMNIVKPLVIASLGLKRWAAVKKKALVLLRRRTTMPISAREALRGLFQPDIGRLEVLLQREFSCWW